VDSHFGIQPHDGGKIVILSPRSFVHQRSGQLPDSSDKSLYDGELQFNNITGFEVAEPNTKTHLQE